MMFDVLDIPCSLKHFLSNHVLRSVHEAVDCGIRLDVSLREEVVFLDDRSSLSAAATTYARMVATRRASRILRCCSAGLPVTLLPQSRVLQIVHFRLSPVRSCNLRPWRTEGHDTYLRCRSRAGAPT
eukprot:6284126-Pyramimonas_sp.AAC.1